MDDTFERLRCDIEHLRETQQRAEDVAGKNEELRLLLETYLEQVSDAIADTRSRWQSLITEHSRNSKK